MSKVKKKAQQKPQYLENPLFNYFLLAAFALFLCYFTTFKITGDDDVFWHLATGKYILQTHQVPSTDIFGYMTQGQEWMPFEWGWDVLTFLLYNISGYYGLSVLRTLIFIVIFAILLYTFRKFGISWVFSLLFMTVLSFAIMDRLTPRPHVMSYLFFLCLLLIIFKFRYFDRGNKKVLYFIPVIFLVWSNMHMGIIAGGFLMLLYFSAEFISTFSNYYSNSKVRPLTKNELLFLFIILASSAVCMLANPNFIQTYVYAYQHTKMKMLETVNEWMSPFGSRYGDTLVNNLYKLFLVLGFFNIYYTIKKRDILPALLFIGFGLYSVRAMRFTIDYVIIMFPFIVISLYTFFESFKSESFKLFISKKPYLKIALALFLAFLIYNLPGNKLYLEHLKYYRITGFGINSDFIPVQLFDFMKRNNVPEISDRVFNHFGTGGYFVWSFDGKKNFIDSRNLNDDIFNKYQQILSKQPGFEQKLDEYEIEYAIYLAPDLVRDPKEMENTVISYFCKNNNWKLIFWDDKSFLWVRNIPKFAYLVENYEYRYLTPYTYVYQRSQIDKGLNEDTDRLKNEVNRKKDEDPKSIILNSFLNVYGNKLK